MRFSLVFLFALSLFSFSQNCSFTLKGTITDFHDGSKLEGAKIIFEDFEISSKTDKNGYYMVNNLCSGVYRILVIHDNCDPYFETISIEESRNVDFRLEHHMEELHEVDVVTNKIKRESKSGVEDSFGQEEIEKFNGLSLGDALKEVPGISSLNTGATVVKPVIHGLHSSRIIMMNNNVRMQDQEWGAEHAPNIDLNSTNEITVIKGAGGLKYGGDAVGGVIVLKPVKAILKDSLYGKTLSSLHSNGRGGSLTTSLTKGFESGLYFRGQGTFKYFGDKEAPDYILSNTGQKEYAFSFGTGIRKFKYGIEAYYSFFNTELGILRASHFGNIEDLLSAINSPAPLLIRDFTYTINNPKQDVTHHLFKTNTYLRFKNAGRLDAQYSFQKNRRLEFDIRRVDRANLASMDMDLQSHDFRLDYLYDAGLNFEFKSGLNYGFQENTPNPNTGVRRLIPDYVSNKLGAYFLGTYDLNDKIVIDAGFRYDYNKIDAKKYYQKSRWEERGYDEEFSDLIIGESGIQWYTNPVFDYHSFSASLGLSYELSDSFSVLANISLSTRPPNPAELFSDGLHHSAASFEIGDLRIQQEQALKSIIEFEWIEENFYFNLGPYYNKINDYIFLAPIGTNTTNRGTFPVYEFQQVDARILGFDFKGGYTFNEKWSYDTGLSMIEGKNLEEDIYLIDMPTTKWTNRMEYSLESFFNLKMGLESQISFEKQNYPDLDFETAVLQSNGEIIYEAVPISQPPPGYHLLHFDAGMKFQLSNINTLELGFAINNLTNTKYRDYLNRQRYFADEIGRNFILNLKINY